mgnify:CR=1 FL=1
MTVVASALERPRGRVPRPVLLAIAAGWALAVTAELTDTAGALHHDALIEGGSAWAALLVVPTVVAGMFGMNLGGIPGNDHCLGFVTVTTLTSVVTFTSAEVPEDGLSRAVEALAHATYEAIAPGLAAFLSDAIQANAARHAS